LIRAFAEALKVMPQIYLVITGDGKLKNYLMELTEKLEVKQKVIFTGFYENLSEIYSAFDIYAHTSVEGGGELFPISIINALAQGLPVIATDIGDVGSMITNGKNGYLVKDKDVSAVKEKIIKLAEDKETAVEFGQNSRKLFESKYTIDNMTASVYTVYKAVVNNI
jgi:glycosyltransferase involved in cell wall biosynthesis